MGQEKEREVSASHPPFSIIIPAHNEAGVIDRCLGAILRAVPADAEIDIIVACNGCTDDTAQIAARHDTRVRVLELEQGSKPLALNSGHRAARFMPQIFVDADIVVSYRVLQATASALAETGVMAAAPALDIDVSKCTPIVRSYYRVWKALPYVRYNMVGSGVFGLSAEGLGRVAPFPDIIADDEYVRTRFGVDERKIVDRDEQGHAVSFLMFPPRNLGSLIRIESRQRAGMAQLRTFYPNEHTQSRMTSSQSLLGVLGPEISPVDLVSYLAIKLVGRIKFRISVLRGQQGRWLRDDSSRVTAQ